VESAGNAMIASLTEEISREKVLKTNVQIELVKKEQYAMLLRSNHLHKLLQLQLKLDELSDSLYSQHLSIRKDLHLNEFHTPDEGPEK
jgi:hypothetical protein